VTLFEIQSELNQGKAVRIPAKYVGHVMEDAAACLPADVVWDVLVERGAATITDPRYWGKPADDATRPDSLGAGDGFGKSTQKSGE
jgi:hypothetical protein